MHVGQQNVPGTGQCGGTPGQGQGQVGQGQNGGCMGPGVTPQSQRFQDVLRLTGELDVNQLARLRQVLGEQVVQTRGLPEMFGQRTASGFFPQGLDPMHVPGSGGEFVGDVFAKSEKWLGTPPVPDVNKWTLSSQGALTSEGKVALWYFDGYGCGGFSSELAYIFYSFRSGYTAWRNDE
eukprot:s4078_g5.t1